MESRINLGLEVESKVPELASQEQLEELVSLADQFTSASELLKPNESEEYRYAKLDIYPTMSVQIYSPEGRMAKEVGVASVYWDWEFNGQTVSRAVNITRGEDGLLTSSESWDGVSADNLGLLFDLGVHGKYKDFLSKYERQDYDMDNLLGTSISSKALSREQAAGDLEFLQDTLDLENNGLKDGDISIWKNPETGEEQYVLIYRGERQGWIKHRAMYYLLSPLEEGEDPEAKKVCWHDIAVSDLEGRQYMLHTELNFGWVFREDITSQSRLSGDCSEEAIHQLHVSLVQIPPEAEKYYDKYQEGSLGTEHDGAMTQAASRITEAYTQKRDKGLVCLREDLEQLGARYCSEVTAAIGAESKEAAAFRQLSVQAWEEFANGTDFEAAFMPAIEYAQGLHDQKTNWDINGALISLVTSMDVMGKPS